MSSYVLLANLRAGRCSSTAEVRLLRFWEARNVRKDGELMSLDMLLLDEQVNPIVFCFLFLSVRPRCLIVWFILDSLQSMLIHGSINSSRVDTFRRRLSEGSVYSLSGFDVARANPKFRLSDSPVSIRFNDGTFFETKTDSDKDIPTELFRFRSHEQLLTLANTNRELLGISLMY